MNSSESVIRHLGNVAVILVLGLIYVTLLSVGSLWSVSRRQFTRTGQTVKTALGRGAGSTR